MFKLSSFTDLKNRSLSLIVNDDYFIAGVLNEAINITGGNKVIATFTKSVKSMDFNEKYLVCASYDGTAVILDRNSLKFIDSIEGPDTEIKCVCVQDSYIALATRGKTVWVLDGLEIVSILDDHTQDVKGCFLYNEYLYTWSYDQTICIDRKSVV